VAVAAAGLPMHCGGGAVVMTHAGGGNP
jgi:hypothetical protein